VLGFEKIPHKGYEFPVRIFFDEQRITNEGDIDVRIASPLAAVEGLKVSDLENKSLRPEMDQTLFVLSDRLPGLGEQLRAFIAMRTVINIWKGNPHASEEARNRS